MILYDADADAAFVDSIDGKFPYNDPAQATATIAQGWSISLNAAFCVLHEICRPGRGVDVRRQRLVELLSEWQSGPEHDLKVPLATCASTLIDGVSLPRRQVSLILDQIAQYDAQRAALSIAYFTSDCDAPEDDRALNDAYERIRREWERKGV
jgi:hypothetical protein